MKDRCGSEGEGFFNRLLSLIIPDSIFNISIAIECEMHDVDYSVGGDKSDRLIADKNLRYGIHYRLRQNGIGIIPSCIVSSLYFYGVRLGGKKHFNFIKKESI